MPDPKVTVLAPGVSGEDMIGRPFSPWAKPNAERAKVAKERKQRAGRAGGYAPKRLKHRTAEKRREYNNRWRAKKRRREKGEET
jgi:hypothetical protein